MHQNGVCQQPRKLRMRVKQQTKKMKKKKMKASLSAARGRNTTLCNDCRETLASVKEEEINSHFARVLFPKVMVRGQTINVCCATLVPTAKSSLLSVEPVGTNEMDNRPSFSRCLMYCSWNICTPFEGNAKVFFMQQTIYWLVHTYSWHIMLGTV